MIKIPYTSKVIKLPKKAGSKLAKLETLSGRCAMVGMYNIAFPAHIAILPVSSYLLLDFYLLRKISDCTLGLKL